jgi:hypothetical protein
MLRFSFILCISTCAFLLPAQDLDDLGEGLDLSILDEPIQTPKSQVEDTISPLHLFAAFESAPHPKPPEGSFTGESGLQILQLPKSPYLVAPNPARIDTAYQQMQHAVKQLKLQPVFPLKIVIHTDGNVSVGCAVENEITDALPPGTDLSPQPAITLAGIWADIQVADRKHPLVVAAFQELRKQSFEQKVTLDTSELYLLPAEPGKVFVALRVIEAD